MKSFRTDRFEYLSYTEMDAEMSRRVWECRNLPQIRRFMVNQDEIPFESHRRFVENLKRRDDALYYCVLSEGRLVGTINLHFEDIHKEFQSEDNSLTAERGIFLHPAFQGRGLSKEICRDFYDYLRLNRRVRFIATKVLKDNAPSNALECSLGAEKTTEDAMFNYYHCDLWAE